MKLLRLVAPILFVAISLPTLVAQSRPAARKAAPQPVVLSKWARHVGLHYLGLIDDYLNSKNYDDFARDNKFLDEEERDVEIDAEGPDRIFVRDVLEQTRELAMAEYETAGGHCSAGRVECAGYNIEASFYIDCRRLADEMISEGKLLPFDKCSSERIRPLADKARAYESKEVAHIIEGWSK